MFRNSLGAGFNLGFIFPKAFKDDSAASSAVNMRSSRKSISSFEGSMFSSSHRVKIQDDSDSDAESDYLLSSKKHQNRPSILPKRVPRRPSIDSEVFELSDKLTGVINEFTVYNERDLPFLNPRNASSALIRDNIIRGDVDDDCQTDDEQKCDAKKMLRREVEQAITKYLQDKRDGTAEINIKNLNIRKRYSRVPFNQPCTE